MTNLPIYRTTDVLGTRVLAFLITRIDLNSPMSPDGGISDTTHQVIVVHTSARENWESTEPRSKVRAIEGAFSTRNAGRFRSGWRSSILYDIDAFFGVNVQLQLV